MQQDSISIKKGSDPISRADKNQDPKSQFRPSRQGFNDSILGQNLPQINS
jgi:hypothetical protein